MTLRYRNVAVQEFPETISGTSLQNFMDEFTRCMNLDRPCLVLDCSNSIRFDMKAIHLLLSCLEEAIKRNGDVRLARVSHDAKVILESYGVDGLFEIFDSNAEAINSFYLSHVITAVQDNAHAGAHQRSKGSA